MGRNVKANDGRRAVRACPVEGGIRNVFAPMDQLALMIFDPRHYRIAAESCYGREKIRKPRSRTCWGIAMDDCDERKKGKQRSRGSLSQMDRDPALTTGRDNHYGGTCTTPTTQAVERQSLHKPTRKWRCMAARKQQHHPRYTPALPSSKEISEKQGCRHR